MPTLASRRLPARVTVEQKDLHHSSTATSEEFRLVSAFRVSKVVASLMPYMPWVPQQPLNNKGTLFLNIRF